MSKILDTISESSLIKDFLTSLKNKADKVKGAQNGTIAGFDADGNLKSLNVTPEDITGSFDHYETRYKNSIEKPEKPETGSEGMEEGWSNIATDPDSELGELTWMSQCHLEDGSTYGEWSEAVRLTGLNGVDGKNGADVIMMEHWIKYAITDTPEKPTEYPYSELPEVPKGKYLWSWTHELYNNSVINDSYSVSRVGIDGHGIDSTIISYCQKENTSIAPEDFPESAWGEYPINLNEGWWLYTRTTTKYSDGDIVNSYSSAQIGTGSHYAGTEEYYAISDSPSEAPTEYPRPGKYVEGEVIPIDTNIWTEGTRPEHDSSKPYIWNFEISSDSSGNRYVTEKICIGNWSRGIVAILELYAISEYSSAGASGYPSDIRDSDWTDEQQDAAPTDEKRYQWNKTIVAYNDSERDSSEDGWIESTCDVHYHISCIKSLDGESPYFADIDNEMEAVACDYQGYTTTSFDKYINVSLWKGSSPLSISSLTASNIEGFTITPDKVNKRIHIEIAQGTKINEVNQIEVTLSGEGSGEKHLYITINGVRAGSVGENAILYSLIPSVSSISLKKDGTYSVNKISCTRQKIEGDVITNDTEDGSITYKIDNGNEVSYVNNRDINVNSILNNIQFIFRINNKIVDIETVPLVKDGTDGQNGQDGRDGKDGLNGRDGVDGANGTNSYFHVAYANKDVSGNIIDFSLSNPNGRDYIGTYVDTIKQDSSDVTLYTWMLTKGAQGETGEQGIPGINGTDGNTQYLHIKYSNDGGRTFTDNNGETPGYYLGQYVDFVQEDSMIISKYTWALIKGLDGNDGKDGTGINILGAFDTYEELQRVDTSTLNAGDSYMVGVDLYVWTGSYWKNVGRIKGEDGKDGTNGVNGKSAYLHIAWANSSDGTVDFTTSPISGILYTYMGIYTDNIVTDSQNPESYVWNLIKGSDGRDGLNGRDGVDGADGTNSYFHIAYANKNNSGTIIDFSLDDPTDKSYIGTYVDSTREDSTNPSDYTWMLAKGADGEDGQDGIPGTNGEDGKTSYLHIKYSDDGRTFTNNQGEDPGNYLGQYVDFTQRDSTEFSDYKWSLIKGTPGADGKDGIGINIKGSFDTIEELPMSGNVAGDSYIVGLNLYVWTGTAWKNCGQIRGEKGDPGEDGIDGKNAYAHFAYCNDLSTFADFTTSIEDGDDYKFIGIYTDNTQPDSQDPTKYYWSVFRGKDGESPFIADLDNEMIGIECDSEGNIVGNIDIPLKLTAYYGSTDVTNNCTITDNHEDVDSDITVTYDAQNKGAVTLTFYDGNALASISNIVFTVVHSVYGTRKVTFTVTRVTKGDDGFSATIYSLVPSVNQIVKKQDGTFVPAGNSYVTCDVLRTIGDQQSIVTSGFTLKYSLNDGAETSYPSSGILVSNITKNLKFILYVEGIVVDKETIPLVTDGIDGSQGPKGDSGPEGPQGPQGEQGPKGDSGDDAIYYKIDFENSIFSYNPNTNKNTISIKGNIWRIEGGVYERYTPSSNDFIIDFWDINGNKVRGVQSTDIQLSGGTFFTASGNGDTSQGEVTLRVLLILNDSIIASQTMQITKDGNNGERGKVGRFFYFGGTFDADNSDNNFVVNDAQVPYFEHLVEGQKQYHVFNYDINGSYSMQQMWAISNQSFENAPWEEMTSDFKYIITEAIFSDFAKFGSAIISGDWMISQNGTIDGEISTNYTAFDPEHPNDNVGTNFIPNYAVDLLTGASYQNNAVIRGTVYATDGEFNGSIKNGAYVEDSVTKYKNEINTNGSGHLGNLHWYSNGSLTVEGSLIIGTNVGEQLSLYDNGSANFCNGTFAVDSVDREVTCNNKLYANKISYWNTNIITLTQGGHIGQITTTDRVYNLISAAASDDVTFLQLEGTFRQGQIYTFINTTGHEITLTSSKPIFEKGVTSTGAVTVGAGETIMFCTDAYEPSHGTWFIINRY